MFQTNGFMRLFQSSVIHWIRIAFIFSLVKLVKCLFVIKMPPMESRNHTFKIRMLHIFWFLKEKKTLLKW